MVTTDAHIITLSDGKYKFLDIVDNKTVKLASVETGEIKYRLIADLEKEEVYNKKEKEKRRNFFKYLEIQSQKTANKELNAAYAEMGIYFMGMLKTKKPRRKEEIQRIVKGLTVVQEGYLIDMLAEYYISTNKPLMRKKEDGSLEILKNVHLEKRYKLSKGQVSKILSAIKSSEVFLTKKGEKGIFVNPEFFRRKTQAKGEYVVRVYQEKMKEIINKLKEILDDTDVYACIGLLNRLSVSFHFATYQLCANPDEIIWEENETVTDALEGRPDAIKFYGTRELLRLVSDGEKEALATTNEYRMKALAAVGAIMGHTTLSTVYYIHPELMDRRFSKNALECEHRRHVIKDFKIAQAASKKEFKKLKKERLEQLEKSKLSYLKTLEKRKDQSSI